uniref:Uncharacterized protein n=1 Tax=Romanomermis culicivorax TaxID=13658 RepID=A0A915JUT5_ROMCU
MGPIVGKSWKVQHWVPCKVQKTQVSKETLTDSEKVDDDNNEDEEENNKEIETIFRNLPSFVPVQMGRVQKNTVFRTASDKKFQLDRNCNPVSADGGQCRIAVLFDCRPTLSDEVQQGLKEGSREGSADRVAEPTVAAGRQYRMVDCSTWPTIPVGRIQFEIVQVEPYAKNENQSDLRVKRCQYTKGNFPAPRAGKINTFFGLSFVIIEDLTIDLSSNYKKMLACKTFVNKLKLAQIKSETVEFKR